MMRLFGGLGGAQCSFLMDPDTDSYHIGGSYLLDVIDSDARMRCYLTFFFRK